MLELVLGGKIDTPTNQVFEGIAYRLTVVTEKVARESGLNPLNTAVYWIGEIFSVWKRR